MLCVNCIKTLYANLSPAATTILKTIAQYRDSQHDEAALNQGQIIKLTGLSISVTRDALNELKGAMMVTATVKGRGIYYTLAEGVAEALRTEGLEAGAVREMPLEAKTVKKVV
jgi:hypothetical protein